jgi:hypothetical protein
MDFNLVSKNNLGVVTALLLVIILSQGRFFNFLLDTALGRAILILFILFISYTNKILGIVSVLFIIIMFNNSNIGYMEGATTMSDSSMSDSSMKNDDKKPDTTTPIATTLANASATPPAPDMKKQIVTKKPVEGGAEGHILPETERSFGKPSNSIPANKTVGAEGFEPYSGSNQGYAAF